MKRTVEHVLLACFLGLAVSACGDDTTEADGGSDAATAPTHTEPKSKTNPARAADGGSNEPTRAAAAGKPADNKPVDKKKPTNPPDTKTSGVVDAGKISQAEADAGDVDQDDAGTSTPQLVPQLIQFDAMYSAHDGVHSFQFTPSVPRAAPNAADPIDPSSVKWTFDKDFLHADAFPDLPAGIQLTTRRPGQTIIKVTAKTRSGMNVSGEAPVTISAVSAAEWDTGFARFFTDRRVSWGRPCTMPGELSVCDLPCATVMSLPPSAACVNCHTNRSSAAYALEYTPTQTARYSDNELAAIFTKGTRRDFTTFDSALLQQASNPRCVFAVLHTWEMSDEEVRGVIAQLRAFPPKANEAIDKTRLSLP